MLIPFRINVTGPMKINSPPCFSKHHTLKEYEGTALYLQVILASELDGGYWLASPRLVPNSGEINYDNMEISVFISSNFTLFNAVRTVRGC
jgi:hypothetical protein